jgi:hypothetical protein
MRKFIKENWIELAALVGLLTGMILLFLRTTILEWFNQFQDNLQGYSTVIDNYGEILVDQMLNISTAELAGFLLAIAGIFLIAIRARYRFLNSARWLSPTCPRCKSELHRVHRKPFDRFLSRTVLPHARRYLCKNPECRWSGLKYIDHGRRRQVESGFITEEG